MFFFQFSSAGVNNKKNTDADLVSSLRKKYGNSLTRNHANSLDVSKLSVEEREALRKLKISLANKGRKPWNIGRLHRLDTVERIRERTRQAMHRTDVQETKKKLRSIMLRKKNEKMAKMTKWLQDEMKIDNVIYQNVSLRFRETFRYAFNNFWQIKSSSLDADTESYANALYESSKKIMAVHVKEVKQQTQKEEKLTLRLSEKVRVAKNKNIHTHKPRSSVDHTKALETVKEHSNNTKYRKKPCPNVNSKIEERR